MAFSGTYSSGNRTTARAGGGFEALVLFPKVFNVFTFRPSGSAGDGDEAQIDIGSTVSGASSSVLRGMWVVIHPTSDVRADLLNEAEGCVQTWARAEVSGGVLKTGLLGYSWSSSDYVSVLSDWRMFANPNRVISGDVKKNIDLDWREPPPRVHGIAHDIVLASSGSASYSPTPTATAMDSGASISSHLWQSVNESGTVNKSRSTSATPTFTLSTGTHWLLYIPTDDNSNDYVQAICVEVVEDDFSSLPTLADDALDSVNYSYRAGADGQTRVGGGSTSQSCSVRLAQGRSDLYPNQLGFVMGYSWFTDGTQGNLQGNYLRYTGRVAFDANTTADEQVLNCELVGITQQMQDININDLSVKLASSPDEWGELGRVSPFDAVWFVLSEHVVNAPPVQAFTGAEDHRDEYIPINQGSVWARITSLMARAQSSVDVGTAGELRFVYDASLKIDSRSFTSRLDATTQDVIDFTWMPITRGQSMERADVGAMSFDTNVNQRYISFALAKNESVRGVFTHKFDGNILPKDLSVSARNEDTGRLAYNYLARDQWTIGLRVTWVAGYDGLLPSRGDVITLTLASDDSAIGEVLSSGAEWMVVGTSVSVNSDGSQRVVSELELVTGGDNRYSIYSIDVSFTPDDLSWIDLITGEPFPDFDDGFDSPYDNLPPGPKHYPDLTRPPEDQDDTVPLPTEERFDLDLSVEGVQYTSTYVPANGEKYRVRVSGEGIIRREGQATTRYDFEVDEQGWTAFRGSYAGAGNGWLQLNTTSARNLQIYLGGVQGLTLIGYEFKLQVISGINYTNIDTPLSILNTNAAVSVGGYGQSFNTPDLQSAGTRTYGETGISQVMTYDYFLIRYLVFRSSGAISGDTYLKEATLTFDNGTTIRYADGRAYRDTKAGIQTLFSGAGCKFETGVYLTQAARSDHVYDETLTGTGSALELEFEDPDNYYEDNQGKLRVQLFFG